MSPLYMLSVIRKYLPELMIPKSKIPNTSVPKPVKQPCPKQVLEPTVIYLPENLDYSCLTIQKGTQPYNL